MARPVDILKSLLEAAQNTIEQQLYFPDPKKIEFERLSGGTYEEKRQNLNFSIIQRMAAIHEQREALVAAMKVEAVEKLKTVPLNEKNKTHMMWCKTMGPDYINSLLQQVEISFKERIKGPHGTDIDCLHVMDSTLTDALQVIQNWNHEMASLLAQQTR